MSVKIGDIAPDFEADTTEGRIHLHDWLGESWVVLFPHHQAATPERATEPADIESIRPEFDRRGVKLIGIVADPDLNVSKLYGMLPVDVIAEPLHRTPAVHATARNLFLIAANGRVKLILAYPGTAERMFDLVLQVIDSLELTVDDQVALPA